MIDLNKSRDFFDPSEIRLTPVHIVGCGAIGSHAAECLARLGVTNIHLWDMDVVESHNIANQMFIEADIGKLKTQATMEHVREINPACEVTVHDEFVQPSKSLKGYVFLCVDSIEPRRYITEANQYNSKCCAIFDFRMGLLSGQFYCADTARRKKALLNTMNFTDEEADINTPKSACNFELSVVYTIKAIIGMGINEAVKCWTGKDTHFTSLLSFDTTSMIEQL